jgi:hypothetical protein
MRGSHDGWGGEVMSATQRRLHELIDFVLDGSCTDDERQEFAQLIDDHPELIKELTEEVFVHSLLQWQTENITRDLAQMDSALMEGLNPLAINCGEATEAPSTLPKSGLPINLRLLSTWFVAATVAVAGIYALWQIRQQPRWSDLAVAEIVDVENVSWAEGTTALKPGDLVIPGRLRTKAGEFTMKFRSGPIVRVIGAVSMMVETDMLVHLDRGQATARVPNSMKGFTIKTPVIDVIDQGTEFGVATRENGFTDIVVFDGKVDLADRISNETGLTRLVQGQAARVDRQGAIQRIMQIGRNQRGSWWTADYPSSGINVIQEVRDNIPPADGSQYFCYQINYHGLDEDTFAYADHPHQWNGLTAEGLPKFLQGADYVKTFNDYRYMNDFQMEVQLSQPANLYIFFDDRVPPPKWLSEQFEDTGVDIGLDEGPWGAEERALRPDLPVFENAVGGGQSIDNVFSVWHRRCLDAKPVVLGIMGEERQARAMYGVAATPLGFVSDVPFHESFLLQQN